MARKINEELVTEILKAINSNLTSEEQKQIISLLKELNQLLKDKITKEQTMYPLSITKMLLIKKPKDERDYEWNIKRVFKIENELLDLLRGFPLYLIVQKSIFDENGQIISMTRYSGEEKNYRISAGKENEIINQINYMIQTTHNIDVEEKIELNNKKFVSHYQMYFDKSNAIIGNHKKTFSSDDSINEGHIVEAFYRHLYSQHGGFEIQENDSYSEDIPYPEIAVELAASVGSDSWFTGGDIGQWQMKGRNRKLASLESIQMVATQLLDIFLNKKNIEFTREDFDKMFNREQQLDMLNPSDEEVKKALNKLANYKTVNVDWDLFK